MSTAIETYVTQVEAAFTDINSDVASISTGVTGLQTQIANLVAQIAALNNSTGTLSASDQSALTGLVTASQATQASADALASQVNAITNTPPPPAPAASTVAESEAVKPTFSGTIGSASIH